MIHCTSCNLLTATPAVVTPARTLLDMWQFSSFKFPIFNSSVSAVSKILMSSPFLWSAWKPAKPSYGGHGQSSSNKWQPDLHTSPIQDYNCHKCISEHRSVATPVTSSRWDYDNIAVASSKWDRSFQVRKHSDHCEAKMTEQSQEQTEDSTTTNSQKPMKTYPRQSQSGAVQRHDKYVTNCLSHDFALDCQMFQCINTVIFSPLTLPCIFPPFFFYVYRFSYLLSTLRPKKYSEQKYNQTYTH